MMHQILAVPNSLAGVFFVFMLFLASTTPSLPMICLTAFRDESSMQHLDYIRLSIHT